MEPSPIEPDEWRMLASCIGLPWSTFFPNRGESTRYAKEVCRNCIVQAECLDDALERKEPAGVRAGLSTRERRKLIQVRKRNGTAI